MFVQEKVRKTIKTDVGLTPKTLYDLLDKEFGFTLDAATELDNPMQTKKFYTIEDDSLTKEGEEEVVGLNPPFSQAAIFAKKSMEQFIKYKTKTIMLIPARIDTKGFHEYVLPYCEIRAVKGRLKFGGGVNGSAPFATIICIYNGKQNIKVQDRGY